MLSRVVSRRFLLGWMRKRRMLMQLIIDSKAYG
ncbi:hypothetical protein LINPERPRIM_LOCUS13669 [Linum perenne]